MKSINLEILADLYTKIFCKTVDEKRCNTLQKTILESAHNTACEAVDFVVTRAITCGDDTRGDDS